MLAGGQATSYMRSYMGGALGEAGEKTSKTGEPDARPLCSGEALRRLVGKCMLGTEIESLCDHLLPMQLAVGVKSGVEIMPHLARHWQQEFKDDRQRVLLSYDQGNAHNEVDRHAFLMRMREIAPGICRWLEYIYPTDRATKVFYRGKIIESRAGGQQGCPLMMACHALVQRVVTESLGLLESHEGTRIRPAAVLDPPARLDLAPNFADDGFLADPAPEVL